MITCAIQNEGTLLPFPLVIGVLALAAGIFFAVWMLSRSSKEKIERLEQQGRRLALQLQTHEDEIVKQQTLMSLLNDVSALMLEPGSTDFSPVKLSMWMVSECVNVDHVCVWQNVERDGEACFALLCRWTGDSMSYEENVLERPYRETLPKTRNILAQGLSINGPLENVPEDERGFFGEMGIRSLLLAPLFFSGAFWGFVSFDDSENGRVFTAAEDKLLRAWGLLAIGAIQRGRSIDDMRDLLSRLEAANRAKSVFLANMSHEIRTPLHSIIGMTTIGEAAEDAQRKDYSFSRIKDASAHLLGVINDILDMSKIEAGKFEIDPAEFEFAALIRRVLSVIAYKVGEKGQSLAVETDTGIPKYLIGDDQRLAQVITNLLSNAVKFTDEGGSIGLRSVLESTDGEGFTVRFEVSDNGIGISEEQQARLFQSFQQAENSTSRKFGGTGLGLSISKNIVEMMGGDIWVRSELHKGSTFMFTVRMLAGRAQGGAAPEGEPGPGAGGVFEGRRVLLAEDVEINREIFIALLEPARLEIACAKNGAEAVAMFAAAPEGYDMIFMDLQMPELDGLEATRRIRALEHPWASKVPILAMTANVFREDIEMCLAAGMDGHLGKPLDMDEIMSQLEKYLG
jgi:signal transduction histidine kinase